jgi:hypothetical protein
VRSKTTKFLEENMRIKFCDPGLDNGFLFLKTKAQVTKNKTGKLVSLKLKNVVLQRTSS